MEKYTKQEIFSLSMDSYRGESSIEKYSAEEREEGLRAYLNELGRDYRENKNKIFSIIEQTAKEILPKDVKATIGRFAEVKTFKHNETVKFKTKHGKVKAVSVALGGTVRRTRVDKGEFIVATKAVQAKVYDEFERFLAGEVDWKELMDMVIEAIQDEIYNRIHEALVGTYASMPTANVHSDTQFDKAEFDRIIGTVKAYGKPVIIGTPVALNQITVDAPCDADKNDIRNKGYLGLYKGCSVVEMEQSFTDETNTEKVFSDEYIFIIPEGKDKIVRVALEGDMITRDSDGQDWTKNFEAYQKVGVGVLNHNHFGIYRNTSL